MADWVPHPFDRSAFHYALPTLQAHWARLHRGDAEPWPVDEADQRAWQAFHAGDYAEAVRLGRQGGPSGQNAANKAQLVYALYLEPHEKTRLQLLLEVAERARALQALEPENANAWFWEAYALGRYAQCVHTAKALQQGLGARIQAGLERTLALAPEHADVRAALGVYVATLIDSFGRRAVRELGLDAATGRRWFEEALARNPHSAIALMEQANGWVMMDGTRRQPEADALYARAAALAPMDATELLHAELARAELAV